MAYGSRNNRKKILDSIVEGADGSSIIEGIESAIQSEDNRSRGRGAASAAKSLEDTYQNVSSMKRSLGAKQQATNEAITERRSSDSKSSIAKDWMTILTGQAEADKPDNDVKFSEQLASRMASPQTVDDKFLVTGKPPPKIDSSSAPYVPSDNPDDMPITYSGDQEAGASGRTAAIDAALEEAIEGGEPAGLMTRPKARPASLLKEDPTQGILDRIAVGEGASPENLEKYQVAGIGTTPYDMVYNYGRTLAPSKPVSEMSLTELAKYQKDLIQATKGTIKVGGKIDPNKGTSAAGKYQVTTNSLFGEGGTAEKPIANPPSWAYKLKLKPTDKFDAALQERIGRLALRETGYDNWMDGKKDETKMLKRISDIWASFEGNKSGQGIHTKIEDIEKFLKQVRPS
jgi:muramidase (phage lysozyme)